MSKLQFSINVLYAFHLRGVEFLNIHFKIWIMDTEEVKYEQSHMECFKIPAISMVIMQIREHASCSKHT